MRNTWFIERTSRKIYSIDDSRFKQGLIKTLLEKMGYKTIQLNSLQSLLEVLGEDSKDTEYRQPEPQFHLLEKNIPDDSLKTFLKDFQSISPWFSYLLDQSEIGFCILNRTKYLMYNTYFAHLIQYPSGEMEEVVPGDAVLIHHRKKIRQIIRQMVAGKNPNPAADFEIVTGLKDILQVSALGFHGMLDNHAVGMVYVFQKDKGNKQQHSMKEQLIREMHGHLIRMTGALGPLQDQKLSVPSGGDTVLKPETLPINLTTREREVLKLITRGYSTPEIASRLFISTRTVEFHRSNLLAKTHTRNTADLVRLAFQNNLIIE